MENIYLWRMAGKKEIRLPLVSPKEHEALKNIAAHKGRSIGTVIQQNLHIIIAQFPAHYTKPMEE